MAEELPIPEQRPEIVDPNNVPVVFADWFLAAGLFEGVVNLSLGTIDHTMKRSPQDMARIVVASRLRLSADFATRLHKALGDVLGIGKPPGEGSHEPQPAAPKNSLN